MKHLLYSFLGLLLSVGLSAQNPTSLGLRECIDYTLKNHLSNTIADNNIGIAKKQKTEGLSGYLPQVNGSVAFDDNIKRQVTVIPAGAFSPVDTRVQFGNQYNTSAVLQAEQLIYDQSLLTTLRAAQPNIELAQLKKEKNEDDLIYQTASAYYQVLIYKEQMKLLAENEKRLAELLAVQKLQTEKGAITRVSYNRVQVNYNNVTSEIKVAQTNYSLAMARLKNAMGIPVNEALAVVDSINYKIDIEMPVINDFNIHGKADYKILEKNITMQEIDLSRKQASVLPTISGYARYGANAFGNNFSKSYDNWYDFTAVGLKLNIPIFSGMRRHSQIGQSELGLYNARQNLMLNAETMNLQLQSAQTQLLSSYSNLQFNKNNMELAKTVFDDTGLQYRKGAATLADFLNAEYGYKEAQTNYIHSLFNFLLARIDLERSKGTIKQFVNQL